MGFAAVQCRARPHITGRDVIQDDDVGANFLIAEGGFPSDGRVDQWETYDQGHVMSIAFDTQHRGTPDRRLVYGADGNLAEVELDPDGDGHWTMTKAAK